MNKYVIDGIEIDSVDLKCMVVSRGVKVDKAVYDRFSNEYRVNISPLACNCFVLPDNTYVQLTDMKFHLRYLTGVLSWDNLKLLRYASELGTPFSIKLDDDKAGLFYNGKLVEYIRFPDKTDFYSRKTSSGLPFMGNSVIQGCDWVAFQCLWPCEYAAKGELCQFCFSGDMFKTLAQKQKPLPENVSPADAAEIVDYGIKHCGLNSIQITGGSTFSDEREYGYIKNYLTEINKVTGRNKIKGEILLYITPPADRAYIDEYFALGADRVACSLELWDEERAALVTPGKIKFTTRKRHLEIMQYTAEKFGNGKAFSNFIIGLESFDTLREGVNYLSERGIIPSASVWMPMGRPVLDSMKSPELDFYRRVKDMYAEAYNRHKLEPAGANGLNVCVERDIWRYSKGF